MCFQLHTCGLPNTFGSLSLLCGSFQVQLVDVMTKSLEKPGQFTEETHIERDRRICQFALFNINTTVWVLLIRCHKGKIEVLE